MNGSKYKIAPHGGAPHGGGRRPSGGAGGHRKGKLARSATERMGHHGGHRSGGMSASKRIGRHASTGRLDHRAGRPGAGGGHGTAGNGKASKLHQHPPKAGRHSRAPREAQRIEVRPAPRRPSRRLSARPADSPRDTGPPLDPAEVNVHRLGARLVDGHTRAVYCCEYSHDGATIVSASHDGTVVVWNVTKLAVRRTLRECEGFVFQARFSPDDDLIACAVADGLVRVYSAKHGRLQCALSGHEDAVTCCAWSRDGHRLATGSRDRSVIVWEVPDADGQTVSTIRMRMFGAPHDPSGHEESLRDIRFTPDGRSVVSCADDKTIRIWAVETGKLQRLLSAHQRGVNALAFNTDSTRLASCSSDGTIRVWDFNTGACTRVLTGGHDGVVYAVCWSPERRGRRLVSGGHDRTIAIWEYETGELMQKIPPLHLGWVLCVAFAPTGLQFCAASGDQTLSLWNATNLPRPPERRARTLYARLRRLLCGT